MRHLRRFILPYAALLVLSLGATAGAQARTFVVRNDGGSRVQFTSDAPLETITGVTSALSGSVEVDPASLATARGHVDAAVATLRTGVDLRDEHLRGASWLDAGRFPDARFELVRVEGATALRPDVVTRCRVHGRFTVHGVTREVTADARVRWLPLTRELSHTPGIDGDVLRVQATFSVRLTDHSVSVPLPVRLKVANEIAVSVDLRAVARSAAGATR
jgi:polyisoprenoid-binding protein YceI